MTTTRFICVLAVVLCASASLAACGGDTDTGNTFSCMGGGTTMNCASSSQYCEEALSSTDTVIGATCRALPAGCGTTSPCGTGGCLASGSNGIIGCSSFNIAGSRSTTVRVRR